MTATQIGDDMNHTTSMTTVQPAVRWEDALPLGNGQLGALLYGGICSETVVINEQTMWGPADRAEVPDVSDTVEEIRELLDAERWTEASERLGSRAGGPRLRGPPAGALPPRRRPADRLQARRAVLQVQAVAGLRDRPGEAHLAGGRLRLSARVLRQPGRRHRLSAIRVRPAADPLRDEPPAARPHRGKRGVHRPAARRRTPCRSTSTASLKNPGWG